MKGKFLPIVFILTVLALTACGATPVSTLSGEDVMNTAVANAQIAWTQTQAALPPATATLIPPTATLELPTNTPPATNTFAPILPTTAATTDPCNQVPPLKPQGALAKVLFVNKSEGKVNLSFGMDSSNEYNECVTYSFYLGVYDSLPATVLVGCYWAYAWVEGKSGTPTNAQNAQRICVDSSIEWPIWISKEVIEIHY